MKLSMIFMASGFGSRFGSNKLMALLKEKPLYLHGLEHLCWAADKLEKEGCVQPDLIVVSQYGQILDRASQMGLSAVYNSRSAEGITSSLRLGTEASGEDADCFLYFVADQPYMPPETLVRFVKGFLESGKGIGGVCCQGRTGNPVIFQSIYRKELLSLSGDKGGKQIMKAHPEDVWTMEVAGEELKDIDLPSDLDGIDPAGN